MTVPATSMPNRQVAPPGYYMLFLINNDTPGRPSKAPFVVLWQVLDSSVSTSGLTVNLDGTFDIDFKWNTTAKATEGDYVTIVSAPPGGDPVPISQGGSISADGLTHTWHIHAYCSGVVWTYKVESKRPKYTTGTDKSTSTSANIIAYNF